MKPALLTCILLMVLTGSRAQSPLVLDTFSSGYDEPLDIKTCGDSRLFIVEKAGKIWICDSLGSKSAEPFLDITYKVGSTYSSQGLLGMAFHPDYLINGYFFVNYTGLDGNSVVGRYQVDPNNPNKAKKNSFKIVMRQKQPQPSHNGGNLVFGPDGYLYIGFGDGGATGDPLNFSQSKNNFLGHMLRINVDALPYTVPQDNPLVGVPGLDQIWAFGFRHPWRYSFDQVTGDLWIGDVGAETWEEINFQPANSTGGENYGWHCYEGFYPYTTSDCDTSIDFVWPIATFQHDTYLNDCSAIGGYVYRGANSDFMYGNYIFTDYCSGVLRMLIPDGSGGWVLDSLTRYPDQSFVSFGQDRNLELYLASIYDGLIMKIVDTSSIYSNKLTITEEPSPQCNGMQKVIHAPSGKGFLYQWYRDGLLVQTGSSSRLVADETGNYSAVITNDRGISETSNSMWIDASSVRPVEIVSATELFRDQKLVRLTGYPTGGSFTAESGLNGQWLDPALGLIGKNAVTYTVTDHYGCTYIAEKNILIREHGISPESVVSAESVRLFPNPVNNYSTIEFLSTGDEEVLLQVCDLAGRILLNEEATAHPGMNQWQLNTGHLVSGVYMLRIMDNENRAVLQFVKE